MAKATSTPKLDLIVNFQINYEEAAALDALSGYGDDAFIKAFYEKLGKSYMRDHEAGLRSFLKSIRDVVNPAMTMMGTTRMILRNYERGQRGEELPSLDCLNTGVGLSRQAKTVSVECESQEQADQLFEVLEKACGDKPNEEKS